MPFRVGRFYATLLHREQRKKNVVIDDYHFIKRYVDDMDFYINKFE